MRMFKSATLLSLVAVTAACQVGDSPTTEETGRLVGSIHASTDTVASLGVVDWSSYVTPDGDVKVVGENAMGQTLIRFALSQQEMTYTAYEAGSDGQLREAETLVGKSDHTIAVDTRPNNTLMSKINAQLAFDVKHGTVEYSYDGWACGNDIAIFGFGAVSTIAACAAAETGIGAVGCAAGFGLTGAAGSQIVHDCCDAGGCLY